MGGMIIDLRKLLFASWLAFVAVTSAGLTFAFIVYLNGPRMVSVNDAPWPPPVEIDPAPESGG